MTLPTASAPAPPAGGHVPRDADATLLANLLRLSPLTLLHAEAGAGKTALLRHDLLPRLRRRAIDRPRTTAQMGGAVRPFPQRRHAASRGEIAVLVDAWGDDPLGRLHTRIATALGTGPFPPELPLHEALASAARRHGVRFLLVLDGLDGPGGPFDAPLDDPAATALVDALAGLLAHPEAPAHVFLVARGPQPPHLRALRERVPGFGDRWLRIRHWHDVADAAPAAPLRLVMSSDDPAPEAAPEGAGWAPAGMAAVDEVAAGAEATAAVDALDAVDGDGQHPATPADGRPTAHAGDGSRARRVRAPGPRMPTFTPLGVGLGLLAAVVAAAALWPRAGPTAGADDPAGARAEATTAAATAGSAATTASPGDPAVASTLGPVVVDALTLAVMDAAPSPLHRELAAALGASLVPAPPQRPMAEALSTAPSGPGAGPEAFAVVRYDTLRALRDRAPAGSLRIVAPLFREPVHVFVPAASPLRSVADLRGHRLNVGPLTPGDTTVGTLYARLFDHPPTAAQLDRTDGPAAMATLGTPSGADALVRVGVLPLPGLDPLPAGWRRLPLDGRGGMDRRARRSYLPADVAGVPTVSVMAFLVAGPHATDAQIAEAVRRLCARLPALRQAGHPAWQDVQPQAAFDTGWPEARAAQAARAACTAPIDTVPVTATRAAPDPARPSGTRPAVPPTRSLEPSP